jgi:3-dehydroquinate dehydratase-2
MRIHIINGPNLNMLGKRDPKQYGSVKLPEILKALRANFPAHHIEDFQSNSEGALIDELHRIFEQKPDGLIYNFGGFTHTSIALRDALELLPFPKIEVHLSNIHAREDFRKHSFTAEVADGLISGFGMYSYFLGMQAVIVKVQGNPETKEDNLPQIDSDSDANSGSAITTT